MVFVAKQAVYAGLAAGAGLWAAAAAADETVPSALGRPVAIEADVAEGVFIPIAFPLDEIALGTAEDIRVIRERRFRADREAERADLATDAERKLLDRLLDQYRDPGIAVPAFAVVAVGETIIANGERAVR